MNTPNKKKKNTSALVAHCSRAFGGVRARLKQMVLKYLRLSMCVPALSLGGIYEMAFFVSVVSLLAERNF